MSSEPVDPRAALGRKLTDARLAHKLSVEGLAAISGVDASNIRRIERGAGNPQFVTLLKLTGALELDLCDVFRDLDPMDLPDDLRPVPMSQVDPSYWRPSDRIA